MIDLSKFFIVPMLKVNSSFKYETVISPFVAPVREIIFLVSRIPFSPVKTPCTGVAG
jgi:hypothetical protein